MNELQAKLTQLPQYLEQFQSRLPDWAQVPQQYWPLVAFGVIALFFLVAGRLMVGGSRRRGADDYDAATGSGELVFGPLTGLFALLIPTLGQTRKKIERELKHSGNYRPKAVQEFLAVRNVLSLGWLFLVIFVLAFIAQPNTAEPRQVVVGGAIVMVIIFGVPRLWLQAHASRRLRRIQETLPDALDMITMCLTGGLPLQPALERVSRELKGTHADLGLELEIIRRQSEAHTLERALLAFSDRIDVPEVRSLAALVNHTERLGTNVGVALREYSDGLRRSHRQRAEERGNTASVKLLLPVALCLAPPVYILLLAPPLLEMRNFIVRESEAGGALSQETDPTANPRTVERRSLRVPVEESTVEFMLQQRDAVRARRDAEAARNATTPQPGN